MRTTAEERQDTVSTREALAAVESRAAAPVLLAQEAETRQAWDEAVRHWQEACQLDAAYLPAVRGFALLLTRAGQWQAALGALQQWGHLAPDEAEAVLWLAHAQRQLRQDQAAYEVLKTGVSRFPGDAALLTALGTLLAGHGRQRDALPLLERATRLQPEEADCFANLGQCQLDAGKTGAGLRSLRRCLALKVDHPEALLALGRHHLEENQPAAAEQAFRSVLKGQPRQVTAHYNLAQLEEDRERRDRAEVHLRAVLEEAPNHADAHFNLALLLLRRGAVAEGWEHYRWRVCTPAYDHLGMDAPYDAAAMPFEEAAQDPNRALVIRAEQGVGDELLFANLMPRLEPLQRPVILECEARLVGLFRRSFPWACVVQRFHRPIEEVARGPADVIPIGDLAGWVSPRFDSIHGPLSRPALQADPVRRARWQNRLAALPDGLRVGLCWRSMKRDNRRALNYAEPEELLPLLDVDNVQFVNLQYDRCDAEIATMEAASGRTLHRFDDLDLMNDFEKTAALIASLDLVIAPGTCIAELAGALGTPTWKFARTLPWTSLGTGQDPWHLRTELMLRATLGNPFAAMARRLVQQDFLGEPSTAHVLTSLNALYPHGRPSMSLLSELGHTRWQASQRFTSDLSEALMSDTDSPESHERWHHLEADLQAARMSHPWG